MCNSAHWPSLQAGNVRERIIELLGLLQCSCGPSYQLPYNLPNKICVLTPSQCWLIAHQNINLTCLLEILDSFLNLDCNNNLIAQATWRYVKAREIQFGSFFFHLPLIEAKRKGRCQKQAEPYMIINIYDRIS